MLQQIAAGYKTTLGFEPGLYIFVHADLNVSLKRIQKRGRVYEQNINTSYLEAVDLSHKTWHLSLPEEKKMALHGETVMENAQAVEKIITNKLNTLS